MKLKELIQSIFPKRDSSLFFSNNKRCIYLNLHDVIGIFPISHVNRITKDTNVWGFNIIYASGVCLYVRLESEEDIIPPLLRELYDLFVNNMGLSFIQIDREHYKNITFKFTSIHE